MVTLWTQVDTTRWIAGILSGILAGAISVVLAMVIATAAGHEFWFPVKLMATTVLGPFATEVGPNVGAIVVGFLVYGAIATFWGLIFGHFVRTNALPGLLGMGVVWALFLWIFNWNLYLQSFRSIFTAAVPGYLTLPVCLVYGLSLCSIAFFDRTIRGNG